MYGSRNNPNRDIYPHDELPVVDLHGIQQGDLLFLTSDGQLQDIAHVLGESWTHVALVIETNGELCTAEVGVQDHVGSRRVESLLNQYDKIAVGRPSLPAACVDQAVASAKTDVRQAAPSDYAWDDVLTAIIVLLTRQSLPHSLIKNLGPALAHVEECCDRLTPTSRTCSYYLHEAFTRAGDGCALSVPILIDDDGFEMYSAESVPPSMAKLMDATDTEWDDLLANHSLMDVVANDPDSAMDQGFEMYGSSRASGAQLLQVVGRTARLVAAMVNRPAEPTGRTPSGLLHGRWVSPTDLWLSAQIDQRARLVTSPVAGRA